MSSDNRWGDDMTRFQNSTAATEAWDEAYSYKPAPVVIHVPLGSYLRFAAVVIMLGVALLNLLPNPVVMS